MNLVFYGSLENQVQVYAKVTDCRTVGHFESEGIGSINLNSGPDDCVWYTVPIEFAASLEKLLGREGANLCPSDVWLNERQLKDAGISFSKRFLEAIRSLVLFLGILPSEIHEKIHQKIQKIDKITSIQNKEVTLALELLVLRIVNHSVSNLSENEKSVSLKEFLCYLKSTVLKSKLEGLENLLKKIEENIKELGLRDKIMATNDSYQWESDPEYIELMDFLTEKTKDVKSPLNIIYLAREYRVKKRFSQDLPYYSSRINYLRGKVGKSKTIDRATKVKLIFALSSDLSTKLQEELQMDAYVKVDEYQRITKYSKYDGSLNLEGEHEISVKSKARKEARESDGSMTPESTKRTTVEVPDNSLKRPKIEHMEPLDYVPLVNHPLSRSMKILNYPEIQLPRESSREPPNSKPQELREPKREIEYIEVPEASESPVVKTEDIPRDPESSESSRSYTPQEAPRFEADKAQTLQIKFHEAIQSLALFLSLPQAEIHQKIEEKIQNIDKTTTFHNNEVALALELLVARIVNHSVSILPENVKSVSLKEFLCYLKAAILNSKLEALENLLKKVEENIKEPESQDKNISMEKVTRALQDTLNNVGF